MRFDNFKTLMIFSITILVMFIIATTCVGAWKEGLNLILGIGAVGLGLTTLGLIADIIIHKSGVKQRK